MKISSDLNDFNTRFISTNGVVCFRFAADLRPEEFVQICSSLGSVHVFALGKYTPAGFPPEVTLLDSSGFKSGHRAAPASFGEGWHQDSTFMEYAPTLTALFALQVPGIGGDTLFADTRRVVDDMTPEEIEQANSIVLEHSVRDSYRFAEQDIGKTWTELSAQLPAHRHKLLHQHARGFKTLLLSPLYTEGTLSSEYKVLYHELLSRVLAQKFQHRWQKGDLLVWDNRVVLHSSSGYRGEEPRKMMRVVIHAKD